MAKKKSRDHPLDKAKIRDMSKAAQQKRVLEYLRAGPQTTYSLRARGISHPAQRIRELIKLGFRIASGRVSAVDSDGFIHSNVALYSVHDREPDLVDLMAEPA
jgi:hypothetical protein